MVARPGDRQRRRPLLRGLVATSAAVAVATGIPLAPADPATPAIQVTTIDLVGAVDDAVAVIARSGSPGAASPEAADGTSAAVAASQAPSPQGAKGEGAALPAQSPAGFAAAVSLDGASESVVFDWDTAPEGDIIEFELRSLTDGTWSPWVHVGAAHEEAPDDAPTPTSAGPVWVGPGTTQVEARLLRGAPTGLRIHALDVTMPAGGGFGIAGAEAAPAAPGIRPATQWGSEGWATQNDGCGSGPSYARTVDYAIVHHTVTTNNYSASQSAAQILSVYWQHVNANGWCDIAYNFVVDRHGQVWEGRSGGVDRAVIGGHARGFNTASTGVVLLGQYHPGASPTAASPGTAQREALRRLLGWKLGLHGVDPAGTVVANSLCTGACRWSAGTQVRLPAITSHRAVGQTACPGNNAENILAGLRPQVANDIVRTPPFPLPTWQEADSGPAILTLDAFGGVHPHGRSVPVSSAHWGNWPVARSMTAQRGQGYVLDDFGGLHPFAGAPPAPNGPYWPGWAIARDVSSIPGNVGAGYVLDGFGGVHRYGTAPPGVGHPYWPGFDIGRAVVARPGGGGYVLDGYGGVHPFGGAPPVSGGPYWPGQDVARDLVLRPDGRSGYVMTGRGTVHPFGGAPALATTWTGATPSSASGMTLLADGTGGWVTDVDGLLHPFGSAPFVGPAHTFALTRAGRSVVVQ